VRAPDRTGRRPVRRECGYNYRRSPGVAYRHLRDRPQRCQRVLEFRANHTFHAPRTWRPIPSGDQVDACKKSANLPAAGMKRTFSPYTQKRRAAGSGYLALEIMARSSLEKNLNLGRIDATSARDDQIILDRGIDQRQETFHRGDHDEQASSVHHSRAFDSSVLIPLSIATGEPTPWPPQPRLMQTAATPH